MRRARLTECELVYIFWLKSSIPTTSGIGTELPIMNVDLSVGYRGKGDSKCWAFSDEPYARSHRELLFRKMKGAAGTWRSRPSSTLHRLPVTARSVGYAFMLGSDKYADQKLDRCSLSATHEASTTACAPIHHGRRSRQPCAGRPERPIVCRE